MTRRELSVKIDYGDDIMLDVRGMHYTIKKWGDDDEDIIDIVEQNVHADGERFDSVDDLLNNFKVHGISLGDLAEEIVITDFSWCRMPPEEFQ